VCALPHAGRSAGGLNKDVDGLGSRPGARPQGVVGGSEVEGFCGFMQVVMNRNSSWSLEELSGEATVAFDLLPWAKITQRYVIAAD